MSTTSNVIAGATLTAALVGGALLLSPDDAIVASDGGVVDAGQQSLVYFLATDGRDVVHCGAYDPETQRFGSGQPIVHQVDTEAERDAIAASLGVECPRDEQPDAGVPDAGLLLP